MKFFAQLESKDCGPTCLKTILFHYGKRVSLDYITELCNTNIQGTSIKNMLRGAEMLKFEASAQKIGIEDLKVIFRPIILYINNNHYVIIYKYSKEFFYVADPAMGKYRVQEDKLSKFWLRGEKKGIAILLNPLKQLSDIEESTENYSKIFYDFKLIFLRYKFLIVQILLGVVLLGGFQLIFPFLNQYMVDKGVKYNNVNIVGLLLLNQFLIFIGKSITEFIQARIMLYVGSRLSISLVSNFFVQLMQLPISFFDIRSSGDIYQRIVDHNRIENFFMNSVIEFILSVLTFVVLSIVLFFYSPLIFVVFLVGSILHFIWIIAFLNKRKLLDYLRFEILSRENSLTHELISGMQELKLYNAQWDRKKKWENVKIELYDNVEKSFSLNQLQFNGAKLINEIKNISINGIAAFFVISGNISLGAMFSIMFMSGQLNIPIQSFSRFITSYQDTKIAMQRISSIYSRRKENQGSKVNLDFKKSIKIEGVNYLYSGESNKVLDDISVEIPLGKKIAIVGKSGSGKTTLIKLLLKFYTPDSGIIKIDGIDLQDVDDVYWREQCGTVMQDGYIFNDTILKNIVLSEKVEMNKVFESCKIANIASEISLLPNGLDTVIGFEGRELSKGQKQRLLIARAVYKSPNIFFFDEATSALDTENEKIVTENLKKYLEHKTTIVVAHRLSTILDADLIIVMDSGRIVEIGTHNHLISRKRNYYNLVKNQIDINYL